MRYVGYLSIHQGCWGLTCITVWLCLDHRTYCSTEEEHEHRHLTQIQAIKLFMTGRRPHLRCKQQCIVSASQLNVLVIKYNGVLNVLSKHGGSLQATEN